MLKPEKYESTKMAACTKGGRRWADLHTREAYDFPTTSSPGQPEEQAERERRRRAEAPTVARSQLSSARREGGVGGDRRRLHLEYRHREQRLFSVISLDGELHPFAGLDLGARAGKVVCTEKTLPGCTGLIVTSAPA